MLPELVPPQQLMTANAWISLNDNLARVAGPAIGGLTVAWVGFGGVVVLNPVWFLLACSSSGSRAAKRASRRVKASESINHGRPGPAAVLRRVARWLGPDRPHRVLVFVFVVAGTAQVGDAMFFGLLAPTPIRATSHASYTSGQRR